MITLGTFNLRVDTKIDGARRFTHRKAAIVEQFIEQAPTIMGLQEVSPLMLAGLTQALPGYTWVGDGRNKNRLGEHNPIAFKKDQVNLIAHETFWLSPTPRVAGSRYIWQSPYPRICTWAIFCHKATQKRFRFYNTHLDHLSAYARKKAVGQIISTISAHQREESLPLFLVGDFNFTPRHKEYALLTGAQLPLQNLAGGVNYTYHGFHKRGISAIDYILTNIEKTPFSLDLWEKSPQGTFLSDHRGLVIAWKI